jgi:hypothetical protein
VHYDDLANNYPDSFSLKGFDLNDESVNFFFFWFYCYFLIRLFNLCYYFPKMKNYQQIYCLSLISNVDSPTKIKGEIDVPPLVQAFTCLG